LSTVCRIREPVLRRRHDRSGYGNIPQYGTECRFAAPTLSRTASKWPSKTALSHCDIGRNLEYKHTVMSNMAFLDSRYASQYGPRGFGGGGSGSVVRKVGGCHP
jgi:hypothetical protein